MKMKTMNTVRLIARLDVKGQNLIKGIHLEGLRVVGKVRDFAKKYYEEGIDEILFMDAVASLYGRNSLKEVVSASAKEVFVPMTVGGGIRSLEDVHELLCSGADKVAINTAAVKNPALITEVARRFGKQCMVLSVEAKRKADGGWEAYIDNGREHTGKDVLEWISEAEERGAGEILLTSVDQEGTGKGFDIELLKAVSSRVKIPVIASGGMGTPEHAVLAVQEGMADAVAMASILHYDRVSIGQIRETMRNNGIEMRYL